MSRLAIALGLLIVAAATPATAQQRLASRLLQDEAVSLPAENTAFFTAAREVSIQLDLLAAVPGGLDDALVSVISPNGEARDFEPDQDGVVRINNVQAGPHAIVASTQGAHGSTLVYLEQKAAGPRARTPDPPTRMTLVKARAEDLQPFVDQIRELSGSMGDVKQSMKATASFDFRVRLDAEGNLNGRVISVGSVPPTGTNISILQARRVVAKASAGQGGEFQISGITPGVYGVIAAGPAGYAAFGFEAVAHDALVLDAEGKRRYVAKMLAPADALSVILIPPAFAQAVYDAIVQYYPELADGLSAPAPGEPLAIPFAGGPLTPGAATGPGRGGGGGGGSVGGGGLGAFGAIAGLGAAAAASSSGGGRAFVNQPASPANPVPESSPVSASQPDTGSLSE